VSGGERWNSGQVTTQFSPQLLLWVEPSGWGMITAGEEGCGT